MSNCLCITSNKYNAINDFFDTHILDTDTIIDLDTVEELGRINPQHIISQIKKYQNNKPFIYDNSGIYKTIK